MRVICFLVFLWVLVPGVVWCAPEIAAEPSSVEERRLLVSLAQRQELLLEREKKVAHRETELKILEREVDKKIQQYRELRDETRTLLEARTERERLRVEELSAVYDRMDPARAAEALLELELPLAIDILSGMKTKAAAKVLNNMTQDQAAEMSRGFSSLNPR
jgi:flagellar motility protein MotE (MotC chaperone)